MEPMEKTTRLETHTLLLMQEAQDRGHALYHFSPLSVFIRNNSVFAKAREVKINLSNEEYYSYGNKTLLDLSKTDVVMVRQDPPFDMDYITNTYFLEMIHPETLVVNNPFWIRNMPEKLYPLHFSKYIPPTIISHDYNEIERFRKECADIVKKPIYDFHGNGVELIKKEDCIDDFVDKDNKETFIFQKYIEDIKNGNKRVVFLNGKIAGALITRPEKGEFRVYRDSTDHEYILNKRDMEICTAVGNDLKNKGMIFVGIDIIGDYLTEINTTSVGSIRRLNNIYNIKFEEKIWDTIEEARA